MKTWNKILIIIGLVLTPLAMLAQGSYDALRYSQIDYGGTARFTATGGAFGALGGDLSAITVNPAGVAVFQNSEATFSPGYFYNKSDATYMLNEQNQAEDYTNNLNINNAGFAVPFKNDNSGWKSFNVGAAYNRLANFNRNILIKGMNPSSSLADVYVWQANNGQWQNDLDRLPYDGFLVDSVNDNFYSLITDDQNYDLEQRKYIDREGSMNELTLSVGANYNHVLYLGASLGFTNIRYNEDISYTENDVLDKTFNFISFTERENVSVEGSGFNLKLGAIVRPTNWLRIGGAFHTPTFLNLQETYYASMETRYELDGSFSHRTDDSYFEYEINTPMRAMGSVAFMIMDKGFVSAEYEYVNYSLARMRADQYDFDNENDNISNRFTGAHNFRLGAEYRIVPFSIRAGYAYYASPYQSLDFRKDRSLQQFTAGMGINSGSFYFDASGVYSLRDYTNLMYQMDIPDKQAIVGGHIESTSFKLVMTLGFRF